MTNPAGRYRKRNSVHIKIGILMTVAVMLLTTTCFLLYRNLSSIVSSIPVDINPELRLMSIRNISTGIEKAGNSIRIYTITGNPSDIKPYYSFVAGIDKEISKLREECNNDSILLAQTDTISTLIEENIIIWNKLLSLYKEDNIIENLRQLSGQLDTVSKIPPKQGILKRVFSRSPEITPVEHEIAADLDSIVEQTEATREKMALREVQLARNSSEISGKFYDLITRMENEVNEIIRAKAEIADAIAGKTYRWLIMLSISGGLLAILIIYIIIRYSRNVYAYQEALENSKNEAEKLAKTKEMFMAKMSHEIRTPVTAISGFTEQLLHESVDENTASSLKIIKASSDHLLKIIDDILDFSKLKNNKLVLEKVHFRIREIMDDVCRMFEKQARKNNTNLFCNLSNDTPPVLIGDPYRLKQIMINILSNSVKFTKNGSIHLEISSIKKTSEELELVIKFTDTGIGIDESRLNAIFEDFTQAEMSTTRKYGGSGLGLSIVKQLVEMQNGTINLTSKKNVGTTVECRLPFRKGDENQIIADITRPVVVPEEISGMKVLVADDEEYNRLLFKKILDKWNIDCHFAVNGMEAIEMLKDDKFDLLFMDMFMPGIDGLKTTMFIRGKLKISEADMPVIFISAAPSNEEWQKYRKAGFNTFIQKPFTEEMLLSTIMSVTGCKEETITGNTEVIENNMPESSGKINLNNIYHISGGDKQFVRQMLDSFISTTGEGLNDMREAIEERRWESVAAISHRIQPPCSHLGATELYSILKSIENDVRENKNIESIASYSEKAIKEFGFISSLIQEHISKMN